LPPARTDIAHYTARVLPALSELAEVVLWTDQKEWDQSLRMRFEVRDFSLGRMPWVELNRADANFYNIGNNPLFHSSIWQISRRHAGIIVLHDLRLHHFFDDIFRVNWRDLDSYLAVMEGYYGEEGRKDAAECFHSNARNIDYMAQHYPLTQLAVENQLGVVVHTPEAFELLSPQSSCPIVLAPLPFTARKAMERKTPTAPYRLIIFGYIGKSRRVNSVLKALAEIPEKDSFHLDIYGDILSEEEQLRAQIRALNLKQHVTLHGFATESRLDEALAKADLAINLRNPTMGEASGSQLRIWSHSLPSLVSDSGWYSTLPRDTVMFVRIDDNEIDDIKKGLRSLATDPENLAQMGRRGRKVLDEQHTPQMYARALIDIAEQSKSFNALISANRLAERSGMLLSEWLSPSQINSTGENVAREIFELGRRLGE
jgi:glycosyltransferase involved in cell wall biosynthesis